MLQRFYFLVLLSIFAIGCREQEQGGPPPDLHTWISANLSDPLATGNIHVLTFRWRELRVGSSTSWDFRLALHQNNTPNAWPWKFLAFTPISPATTEGGDSFLWDGLMPADGGRRLPLVPGNYYLGAFLFSNIDLRYALSSVRIIASTWDSDSDGLSNAVETENSGVRITYNGIAHTDWINTTNIELPPTIPTTIPSTSDWYVNRGTHDYSLARGTWNPGTLQNGLRLPDESEGYYHFLGSDPLITTIGVCCRPST